EPAFMRGASYSRRVREAAERLGAGRVFFPGYLPSREKQAYFRLAHLFVSPSVHESYGLTLAEAMRAGLPVLAGDHHGAREMLGKECGRIVRYGSVPAEALAEGLAGLLGDPEGLRRMGERARLRGEGADFSKAAQTVLASVLSLPLKKS
ncbi:MAG: glycosyltransferase, partial [Elusimicrobiota bacterium]